MSYIEPGVTGKSHQDSQEPAAKGSSDIQDVGENESKLDAEPEATNGDAVSSNPSSPSPESPAPFKPTYRVEVPNNVIKDGDVIKYTLHVLDVSPTYCSPKLGTRHLMQYPSGFQVVINCCWFCSV